MAQIDTPWYIEELARLEAFIGKVANMDIHYTNFHALREEARQLLGESPETRP